MASACDSVHVLLSAYADGEASEREKQVVESHLPGCAGCRARLADLKALSFMVREAALAEAEQVDFSGFADRVMREVPRREQRAAGEGLLDRLRRGWADLMEAHRMAFVSSLAGAAVALLVAIPLTYFLTRQGQPDPALTAQVVIEQLQHNPNLRPVVMTGDDGHTLIMFVENKAAAEPSNGQPAPDGTDDGKLSPNELNTNPRTGGDL